MGRVVLIAVAAACVAAAAAPAARAYGWPLKPFDRQHAIRGAFDDPRLAQSPDGPSRSFHFGVDISAPDYTYVYAVTPGRATARTSRVTIRTPIRGVTHRFEYWHVWPLVDTGDRIRLHQRIGVIAPGYEHVHFAEAIGHLFVNPLRRGALSPYVDATAPVVAGVSFLSASGAESPQAVSGVVDVAATVYDLPPIPPPPPWSVVRLSPATIRWRIVGGTVEATTPWSTAVDFRLSLLPPEIFPFVYAPGTRQNKKNRPGNYVYYLEQALDTTQLENGPHALEVSAGDTRGNVGTASFPFTVANPPPGSP